MGKSFRQRERSGVRPVSLIETWLADQDSVLWKAAYRDRNSRPSLLSTWSRDDDSTLRTLDVDLYQYCGSCGDMIIAFEIKDSHEPERYWTRTKNYACRLGSWSALAVQYRESSQVELTVCDPSGKIYSPRVYTRQEYLDALSRLESKHRGDKHGNL